jgi:hypothetical protein
MMSTGGRRQTPLRALLAQEIFVFLPDGRFIIKGILCRRINDVSSGYAYSYGRP